MIDLNSSVNNQLSDSEIRITNGRPVISWEFDSIKVVAPDPYGIIGDPTLIEQSSFHIRIGTSKTFLGNWRFVGNTKDTGVVFSSSRSWAYTGPVLERGITYYGQVLVKDTEGNSSFWESFTFKFNTLPVATTITLSPTNPSANDDIKLSYTFTDVDEDIESGTLVKWLKNGSQQRQFDNQTIVPSEFVSYEDIWMAQVSPSDGFELGPRATSNIVAVLTQAPVGSNVKILPNAPNVNDILKADFDIAADLADKSKIRWYVNDVLDPKFNDQKFARLDTKKGDEVRFELQPFDGVTLGNVVASKTITVKSPDFNVENIRIEGAVDPLNVLSLRPFISWTVKLPEGAAGQYTSIKIGTFAGGDNILSTILEGAEKSFTVPPNLLDKGTDYFISIAVSDTLTFDNYRIRHFRTSGSRWKEKVDNATGWTIETVFSVQPSGESVEFAESEYQLVRIQDGARFAEVRIYVDRLAFVSGEVLFSETTGLDLQKYRVLTIVGKGSDVKIYLDREELIDATALYAQTTDVKQIEFGSDTENASFSVRYQSFYYAVDGAFHPGAASEFNTLQFHEYVDFPFNNAIAMKGFFDNKVNKKVFALNPNDEAEGSKVYAIAPGVRESVEAVPRTFSPINNVSRSPNGLVKVFSHARGASIFKNYLIVDYDHITDFVGQEDPVSSGWELVQNIGVDVGVLSAKGLRINTS